MILKLIWSTLTILPFDRQLKANLIRFVEENLSLALELALRRT